MKQWFSKYWSLGNEEKWFLRDEKQIRWTLWLSQLAVLSVSRMWYREGEPRWKLADTPGLGNGAESPERLRQWESPREGTRKERAMQRSAGYHSVSVYEETTWDPGKTTDGIRGNSARTSLCTCQGLFLYFCVSIPPAQHTLERVDGLPPWCSLSRVSASFEEKFLWHFIRAQAD